MKPKMIGSIIAILVSIGGAGTYGIIVDRPAMMSEMIPVAEQSIENLLALLIIQRADIQHRLWFLQDKIEADELTESRRQRLWELENEYERLDNAIQELLLNGTEL